MGGCLMASDSNHSFMYYIVFILGLSTLLAVTGLLAVSFWISRPINLEGETDRLADALTAALSDNFVPAQNIARDVPLAEFLEHEGVEKRWTFHSFSVTIPPHIKSETLKNELRKSMAAHSVKLVDEEKQDVTGHERFSLYYDNLAFATVTLVPGAAEVSTAYRSDLRNISRQLADMVAMELAALGQDAPLTRADAIDREDLNALWNYTYFTAQLPPGMTLGSLKERLEKRNTLPDVVFSTEVALDPPVSLAVLVAGKPCVGLACTLAPPDAAHQPEVPVTLGDVLEDGILGSEPDESLEAPMDSSGMVVTPVEVAPEAAPEQPAPIESPTPVEMPAPAALPAPERTPVPKEVSPLETPAPQAMALPPGGKIRLAVLIDDGGNNSSHGDRILALDNRLTLAILPNTPFAVEIAEEGAEKGFEIMLHMPMETDSETVQSVPGTVFTKMGKEEIQKLTNAAIDQIPHVVGINNHTGSKFTTDREKMDFVLEVLKERGMYFIDSVTIHTSVAFDAAREMGIPSARRDVFLDDATDIGSVRRQWAILLETAQKHGQAIGIGHFQSPATAKVLAEEIPKLAEAGIELVHASELLQ